MSPDPRLLETTFKPSFDSPHLLDTLHAQVLAQRKNLRDLIQTTGKMRVGSWSTGFYTPWSVPLPTNDPLFQSVYSYTAPILGKTVASHLVRQLETSPNVLTANHQGLDCYSQTIQGTLLFALSFLRHPDTNRTCLPILACGNIPLNNLTYPQGILLARRAATPTGRNESRQSAVKIPIFPRRMQHALASKLSTYTAPMLHNARTRAMAIESGLLASEKKSVLKLLDDVYPKALHYPTYCEQCVDLNARSWPAMFSQDLHPLLPRPVYLGLEHISAQLLIADLNNQNSLIHALMFDPKLSTTLLQTLDTTIGCWSLKDLSTVRSNGTFVPNQSTGTLFFWTLDHKGGKIPMDLMESGQTQRLVPLSATPLTRGIHWTPAGITEALLAGQILPSLFTCYTVLSLARGLVCHGGIYQTEYLPEMQAGICRALQETGRTDTAAAIRKIRTDAFCTGQNLAMARYQDGSCIPAGRIEFMAGGGITPEHLEKMANLTLQEANLAALPETFAPFLPERWQSHQGYRQLTRLILERLGEKMPYFDIT